MPSEPWTCTDLANPFCQFPYIVPNTSQPHTTQLRFPNYLLSIKLRCNEHGAARPTHRHSPDRWHLAKTQVSLRGAQCQSSDLCRQVHEVEEEVKNCYRVFKCRYTNGSTHRYIVNVYICTPRAYVRYVYRQRYCGLREGKYEGRSTDRGIGA